MTRTVREYIKLSWQSNEMIMDKQRNKNILIIAESGLGKTGVPNVIFQVVSALYNEYNIDIVVFNDNDYYADKVKELGANIIKIDLKKPESRVKRLFWRLLKERNIYSKEFNKLFNSKKYDVIHSFKEYDSGYIFDIAKKHNINNFIIHCNREIYPPKNLISRFFVNRAMKLARKHVTKLIGVSSQCCEISYPNIEFEILYNSYNESKYNHNVICKLKKNELVLTHIATFSANKNQLFTLDVFKNVHDKYPNSKLVLVGMESDVGYLSLIKERITNLNLEGCVNIIDGSKDFIDILYNTSYCLLTSLHEAAPISLVEAQACGIKCFASDTIPSSMDCGGVMYLSIKDPIKWGDEIVDCFISNGNKRIDYDMSRFSSTGFKNKLLDIYNKLDR